MGRWLSFKITATAAKALAQEQDKGKQAMGLAGTGIVTGLPLSLADRDKGT